MNATVDALINRKKKLVVTVDKEIFSYYLVEQV